MVDDMRNFKTSDVSWEKFIRFFLPSIDIQKKQSTKDVSWEEMVEDWHRFYNGYNSTRPKLRKVTTKKQLKGFADETVGMLKKLPYNAHYRKAECRSVEYVKAKNSVLGLGSVRENDRAISNTVTQHIKIRKEYRKGTKLYDAMVHEMTHISGMHDETPTEILTLDSCFAIGRKWEECFETAAYRRLTEWVASAIELKARKEGVPDEYREEVEKMIGKPKKKGPSFAKYFGLSRETYSDSSNKSLYEYGFAPYMLVRGAIKRGAKSVKVYDDMGLEKKIRIDSLSKCWVARHRKTKKD